MTIKQQGGIFGRNPTFNDVDANTVITDDLGVGESTPATKVHVSGRGEIIRVEDTDATLGTNQTIGKLEFYANDTSGAGAGVKASVKALAEDSIGRTSLVFSTADASSNDQEGMRLNSSGNLAFPSGKGIDFSATSGTGTSELFDDYEEGTWTPTLGGVTGITYLEQLGTYTKIGNFVHCSFQLRATWTASGNSSIGGLPFTSRNTSSDYGTGGFFTIQGAETGVTPSMYVQPNTSTAVLYEVNNNTPWALPSGSGVYLNGNIFYRAD